MTTCVALLRGINVGGKHSLPMQDLRDILGDSSCHDVRTYIQSGNAVFNTSVEPQALQFQVSSAIEQKFGFAPIVHILSFKKYQAILDANPFPDAVDDPKSLHVYFLGTPSDVDPMDLRNRAGPEETVHLTDRAMYLHTPKYLSGSTLAPVAEQLLGVPATARSWNTVERLVRMIEARA